MSNVLEESGWVNAKISLPEYDKEVRVMTDEGTFKTKLTDLSQGNIEWTPRIKGVARYWRY